MRIGLSAHVLSFFVVVDILFVYLVLSSGYGLNFANFGLILVGLV